MVFILSPKLYLNFYLLFSSEKTRFLIGSAKVIAESLPTKSNFSFHEIIFDFTVKFCV